MILCRNLLALHPTCQSRNARTVSRPISDIQSARIKGVTGNNELRHRIIECYVIVRMAGNRQQLDASVSQVERDRILRPILELEETPYSLRPAADHCDAIRCPQCVIA